MKRAGSTRETLLLIFVSVVGLVLLAILVPGRARVMAPCELLPAQKWELREARSGWQSRIIDHRQGGTLQVESHDVGGPARVSIAVPMHLPPAIHSNASMGVQVEAGQIVARIAPAGLEESDLNLPVESLFRLAHDIATPISGRLRLGDGAMCQVEIIDDLVARIYVSQREPMTLLPGSRIHIEIDGLAGSREAEVLSVPPAPGIEPGQWEFFAELVDLEGLSPGLRGYARVARPNESFPSVLWYRILEQLQPRLQMPVR